MSFSAHIEPASPNVEAPARSSGTFERGRSVYRNGAAPNLLLPIATTSVALHLILVSWFGGGVPEIPVRKVREVPAAVEPVVVEQPVELIQPETPPPEPAQEDASAPTPDAPEPLAQVDLPALPSLQPISAVPSSVAVAFGIEVKGPVRLVSDAPNGSGNVGTRRRAQPVTLDASSAHNLVLPPLTYPARAKRQNLTGTVLIEFTTTPTGDITQVRVRQTSGHPLLDAAARENIANGRWKGGPGFYVKAFEFTLQ